MRCGNPYLGQGIPWLAAFCIPQWLLGHPSPSIAHTPKQVLQAVRHLSPSIGSFYHRVFRTPHFFTIVATPQSGLLANSCQVKEMLTNNAWMLPCHLLDLPQLYYFSQPIQDRLGYWIKYEFHTLFYNFPPCWGSVKFWCGFGSVDPYLWLTDPDPTPDPTFFFSDFKDAKQIFFIIFYLNISLSSVFT